MAVGKFDAIEQYFDNDGNPLAGGKIHSYAGGTVTPATLYTDSTGGTPHSNPVILDSAGRPPGDGLWFVKGVAYKLVITDATDVELDSVDNLELDDVAAEITAATGLTAYEDAFYYAGQASVDSGELYRTKYASNVTYGANWSGCQGSIGVNPAATFVATVKKNGSSVGTITISTGGVYTLATSGGAAVSLAVGDVLTVVGPATHDSAAANISFRWKGALA